MKNVTLLNRAVAQHLLSSAHQRVALREGEITVFEKVQCAAFAARPSELNISDAMLEARAALVATH
eukprot:260036-Pleurochrysis_carterae.AAC.1